MNDMALVVDSTYMTLMVVQAFHLLHHRIVRCQVSYVEGITGLVLCIKPTWINFPEVLIAAHLILVIIQIIGSIFIKKLAPR